MSGSVTGRRSRSEWDDTVQAITSERPHLTDDRWADTIGAALHNEDILGGILRDMLKVDDAPAQRGLRVMPAHELAAARLADLRNGGATTQPFPLALAHLMSGRSQRQVAHKTGISRTVLQRFLHGTEKPTMDEMALIAKGFNKKPWYFHEYRIGLVTQAIADHLASNPEQSIPLAKRLYGGPA